MRISLILDTRAPLRWHGWLAAELAARGLVRIGLGTAASHRAPAGGGNGPGRRDTSGAPAAAALLLRLERAAGRAPHPSPFDVLAASDPLLGALSQGETVADATADLAIDLCDPGRSRDAAGATAGSAPSLRPAAPARRLRPLYDGRPGAASLWAALLAGRAPVVSVSCDDGSPAESRAVPYALPALEDPQLLDASAAMVLARVAEALAAAAADLARRRPLTPRVAGPIPRTAAGAGTAARFVAATLAAKGRRWLDRRSTPPGQWRVGYRAGHGSRTGTARPLDLADFTLLPDDGRRYYADPFLFQHQGQLHLFVEEFPFATRRGLIAHAVLGPDGRFPTPRPLLERETHLSYPQVFAHDGRVWMIPESSAGGGIDLYRADPFPGRFALHARLLDGPYHDATLFARNGRLWLAAGSQTLAGTRAGSSWDALSLFFADHLEGPWTPHPMNPVVVDRRGARPAGEMFEADGALWRPAQDCSQGYGWALTLCRVERLTTEDYAETPTARLAVAGTLRAAAGPFGPHTLNSAGGYEAIDIFSPPS